MYVPNEDNERLSECQDEPTYYLEDGTPIHWLGEFLGTGDDDPTGLIAFRDMIDAVTPHLEARGTPMARLWTSCLAAELDDMGVGL